MSKQKYYAIRQPKPARIVMTWAECSAIVHGAKGALFKSFKTKKEAEAWIEYRPVGAENGLMLFVDGSFMGSSPKAGWGWVAVLDGVEIAHAQGTTPHDALSRNIDGELAAAVEALQWFQEWRGQKLGERQIPLQSTVCHDYEGIGRWALGEWQAKSQVAQEYQRQVKSLLTGVSFRKVSAHSGDRWNDRVDALAKGALLN